MAKHDPVTTIVPTPGLLKTKINKLNYNYYYCMIYRSRAMYSRTGVI